MVLCSTVTCKKKNSDRGNLKSLFELHEKYKYLMNVDPYRRWKINLSFHCCKQKRSTEGCSKFTSPETRQVQERLVSTLEHMQVPKWDRTRCQIRYVFYRI